MPLKDAAVDLLPEPGPVIGDHGLADTSRGQFQHVYARPTASPGASERGAWVVSRTSKGVHMKVRVDDSRCQGDTLCAIAAPELFRLRDDDGHAYVDDAHVLPALEEKARAAKATCPEQAIIVEEDV